MKFPKKAFQRLKNSAPKLDFYKHARGECRNFDKEKCKAAQFTNLNPKGKACPHFKEKKKTG